MLFVFACPDHWEPLDDGYKGFLGLWITQLDSLCKPKKNYRVTPCLLGYECDIGYHSVQRGFFNERCYCDREKGGDWLGWDFLMELDTPRGYKIVTLFSPDLRSYAIVQACPPVNTEEIKDAILVEKNQRCFYVHERDKDNLVWTGFTG